MRKPLIFGHRGVPCEAPENTVASFQRAVELGLDGVELDVQLCKSGELVVFHDFRVDKLTDGTGLVADLSFEEIRRLDAGSHFSEKFRNERIPTLEEVLGILGGRMLVNVELKQETLGDRGLESRASGLIKKMGLSTSVILSSFNPFSIWRAGRAQPDMACALLFADDQPLHLRRAWAARVLELDGLHPRFPLISDALMKRARAKGWFVGTWTVDDPREAERLVEAGVDIIISNRPAQLREELNLRRTA
ncbi:MAG: glycerophosphodiester phosphodiesterase [Candidatus Abyssubacteria bacterium]